MVPFCMEEKGENYEKRELVFCESVEGSEGDGFRPEIDILDEDGQYSVIVESCEVGVVQERYTLRGCSERHVHVLWREREEQEQERLRAPVLFDDYAKWSFPGVTVAGLEPGACAVNEKEKEIGLSTILERLSLPPIRGLSSVTCGSGGGSGDGVTCEVVWEGSRASVYITRRVHGRVTIPLLSTTKHEVAVLGRVGKRGGDDDTDTDKDPDTLVHGVLVALDPGTQTPSVRETLFVHTPFAVYAEPSLAEPPSLPFHATLLQSGEGGSATSGGSAAYMHPVLEWEFSDRAPGQASGQASGCTPHVHVLVPKEYIVDPHTLPQHCHVSAPPAYDIELPAYRVNSSTATTTVHSTALHGSLQLHLRYVDSGGSAVGGANGTILLPPVQILPYWECPLDDDTAAAVKNSFYTDTGRLLYPLNDDNYSNRLYALPIVSLRAEMVTGPIDAKATSVDLATTLIVAMASFYLLFKLLKGVCL